MIKRSEHNFLTFQVSINTIDKVRDFATCTNLVNFDVDLKQLHYTIDAKSIMGIFSFDISKTLTLVIHSTDEYDTEVQDFIEKIKPFIVND